MLQRLSVCVRSKPWPESAQPRGCKLPYLPLIQKDTHHETKHHTPRCISRFVIGRRSGISGPVVGASRSPRQIHLAQRHRLGRRRHHARSSTCHWQGLWGANVVVENQAGASGVIGLQAMAKNPPDGLNLVGGVQQRGDLP